MLIVQLAGPFQNFLLGPLSKAVGLLVVGLRVGDPDAKFRAQRLPPRPNEVCPSIGCDDRGNPKASPLVPEHQLRHLYSRYPFTIRTRALKGDCNRPFGMTIDTYHHGVICYPFERDFGEGEEIDCDARNDLGGIGNERRRALKLVDLEQTWHT